MKFSSLSLSFLFSVWITEANCQPSEIGEWSGVIETPLIPVAVANLPDGRVLYWSARGKFDFTGPTGATSTGIFDPSTGVSTEEFVANTEHDMFCPGTSTLADGRIMITGGNDAAAVTMYNPATNVWTKEPDMVLTRGYHSNTVLDDGSVFTVGGSWSGGRGGKYGEIWEPATNQWRPLVGIDTPDLETDDAAGVFRSDNHMWLFQAPDRRIFQAGPSQQMHWLDVGGAGSITPSIARGSDLDAMNGNAVMIAPGLILTVGGAENYDDGPASTATHLIDINGAEASARTVGSMNSPRGFCSTVVLPSGEVVVFGGQAVGKKPYRTILHKNCLLTRASFSSPQSIHSRTRMRSSPPRFGAPSAKLGGWSLHTKYLAHITALACC